MAMATPVPTLGYWEAVSKLFAAIVANLGLKATEAVFSRRQSPNVRFAPIADIGQRQPSRGPSTNHALRRKHRNAWIASIHEICNEAPRTTGKRPT